MSTAPTSEFDLFDILVKIIPGGAFLSLLILMIPTTSPLYNVFTNAGIGLILGALPLTYVLGVAIQGLSGGAFPTKKHFQEKMKDVRRDISFFEDEMEINGGEAVPRFVWADAILYFKLDEKRLDPSESGYEEKKEKEPPLIYDFLCYPILRILTPISRIDKDDISRKRTQYNSEKYVFKLIEQYVSHHNIGQYERFQALYVLHRTLIVAASILTPLLLIATLSALLTEYQPLVDWWLLGLICLSVFFSIPVFFKGMESYEEIRDKRIMHAYYNHRIRDSPLSDEYAVSY